MEKRIDIYLFGNLYTVQLWDRLSKWTPDKTEHIASLDFLCFSFAVFFDREKPSKKGKRS